MLGEDLGKLSQVLILELLEKHVLGTLCQILTLDRCIREVIC